MKRLAIVMLILGIGPGIAVVAHAQIYKKVMPDGSVVFTDEPIDGAHTINMEPLPTISFPASKAKPGTPSTTKPGKAANEAKAPPSLFSTFTITQPTHDSTVRANNGIVPVSIAIEPPLDPSKGQTITLILDGKPTGTPSNQTSFTLTGIERGSHTVGAEVRDASGRAVAAANPVLFHLLRHSVLH